MTRAVPRGTPADMSDAFPQIEPLGTEALLVRFSDRLDDAANRASLAFGAALARRGLPGMAEVAPGLGSVLVRYDGAPDAAALRAALEDGGWRDGAAAPARRWTIPCSFGGADGPQLDEAAGMAGLDEGQAVEALAAAPLRVLALGFAPGMPYLGVLPSDWDLPRQTGLTPRVPRGALVVAVRQMVLFGVEAPTGWRQVGRTLFGCFEPARERPIALSPGDAVRFEPVSPETLRARAEADPTGHGGATWEDAT